MRMRDLTPPIYRKGKVSKKELQQMIAKVNAGMSISEISKHPDHLSSSGLVFSPMNIIGALSLAGINVEKVALSKPEEDAPFSNMERNHAFYTSVQKLLSGLNMLKRDDYSQIRTDVLLNIAKQRMNILNQICEQASLGDLKDDTLFDELTKRLA